MNQHKSSRKGDELLEDNQLLQVIWQTTSDGLIISDSTGNILTVNKTFQMISGFTNDALIGANFSKLFSESGDDGTSRYKKLYESSSNQLNKEKIKRKNGHTALIQIRIKFFENDFFGRLMLSIIKDVTKKKEKEDLRIRLQTLEDWKVEIDGLKEFEPKRFSEVTYWKEKEIKAEIHAIRRNLFGEGAELDLEKYWFSHIKKGVTSKKIEINKTAFLSLSSHSIIAPEKLKSDEVVIRIKNEDDRFWIDLMKLKKSDGYYDEKTELDYDDHETIDSYVVTLGTKHTAEKANNEIEFRTSVLKPLQNIFNLLLLILLIVFFLFLKVVFGN